MTRDAPLTSPAEVQEALTELTNAAADISEDLDLCGAQTELIEALTPTNPGEAPWDFCSAARRTAFRRQFATTDAEAGTGMSAQRAAVDRFEDAIRALDGGSPGWRSPETEGIFGPL
jgi:hypothetical protein